MLFNWGSDPQILEGGLEIRDTPPRACSLFSTQLQILYFDRLSGDIPAQNTSSSQLLDYLDVISLPQNILSNHWLHFSIYFTINASSLTEQLSDEFWYPINIFSWSTWADCVFYSPGKTSLIPPVSCLSIILEHYQSHLAGRLSMWMRITISNANTLKWMLFYRMSGEAAWENANAVCLLARQVLFFYQTVLSNISFMCIEIVLVMQSIFYISVSIYWKNY